MSRLSVAQALAAALLFGASTPLAKLLVGDVPPLLLAGLLYLGSGVGLGLLLLVRRLRARPGDVPGPPMRLPRSDVAWLAGAIAIGGVLGPVLLMMGLLTASGATASLLLNIEGVLTACIAWVVFRENADRRIVIGMIAIVAGGVLLSWVPGSATLSPGSLSIAGACLCWAIDNNLTRKIATNDAMLVACAKGSVAGVCNVGLAAATGAHAPSGAAIASSLFVGFVGYGLSLTLFVVALRALGAARTGAYFSVAPLFGVALSLVIWPAMPGPLFWSSLALMAVGVWLHVSERHVHPHVHEALAHAHPHTHDAHHRHPHDFAWDGTEPHTHPHRHDVLAHAHAHYPDIHHRHAHE